MRSYIPLPSAFGAPPLPPALIPLPLDPNCPPAVLPSYPNTPNTHSSGYSTAGHSRSSSPMGPAPASSTGIHSQSLLHTLESSFCAQNGPGALLPLPNVNPGIPSDICANNPSLVLAAASNDLSMLGNFPALPGQYVVYFHINPGVSVSFQVGEQIQVVKGKTKSLLYKSQLSTITQSCQCFALANPQSLY